MTCKLSRRKLTEKRGYVTALPFLALCAFFLVLCVIGLVFAVILKDKGAKDTAMQSVWSSGSLLLDFAKLQTPQGSMYTLMSDMNYFFSVDPKTERLLFKDVFTKGTRNCYEAQWYLPDETSSATASKKLELKTILTSDGGTVNCVNMGAASVVLLPHAKVVIRVPDSISSPISGVSIR